ncbi:methyl transferase [Streptococcus pneumoniae]|nr:methyl transferase [Streptococcus pneumoniae]CIW06281.1 methyl transferase [Streptococcus pneumoniae]
MTLDKSQTKTLDNSEGRWTSSVGDSLVKHFHSQADDWDLRTLGVLCSLRLLERPNRSNHVFYSSKMSRVYSVTTRERRLPQSSLHWMSWGMMSNGRCLTVKISKSRKTEKGSLLSDILEDTIPDSYFLSEEKIAQLILKD